jgi:hypothetical protein
VVGGPDHDLIFGGEGNDLLYGDDMPDELLDAITLSQFPWYANQAG